MNEFQEKCWSAVEGLLRNSHTPFTGPIRVEGRRETYFIVQFPHNADEIELFIYDNEAGIMINGTTWTIFESPDFDSEELLVAAFQSHVIGLIA